MWVGLVLISLILLPAEGKHEALYESIKLSMLVGVTLAFAIWYLRDIAGSSSFGEGLLVGLIWAAIVMALDLVLYFVGAFNIGLGEYFTDVASSYLAIPIITTLGMGFLERKKAGGPPLASADFGGS